MNWLKLALRLLLAAAYAYVGYAHLINAEFFLRIMPAWVPFPEAVVFWTGVAEIAGAIALAQPFSKPLRQAGGIGLALYAVCVWPANFNHWFMDMASADGGMGQGYHIPRLFIIQPILIWLALWTAEVPMPWKRNATASA